VEGGGDVVRHELGGFVVWKTDLPKVAAAGAACVPEYWGRGEGREGRR
jgi:hypothetical protein